MILVQQVSGNLVITSQPLRSHYLGHKWLCTQLFYDTTMLGTQHKMVVWLRKTIPCMHAMTGSKLLFNLADYTPI